MSDVYAVDFETYYSAEYSLSRPQYNTSEYVRDPQFLIHGVAVVKNNEPAVWVAGHDESIKYLRSLPLESSRVIAHNMAFDGFILSEHAGIVCGEYADTLSMARATMGHHIRHSLDSVSKVLGLGSKIEGALVQTKGKRELTAEEAEQLGVYAKNDAQLCMEIYQRLLEFMPDPEMELVDITLRMFCDPVLLVDEERVLAEEQAEIDRKKEAIDRVEHDDPTEHLMSNEKFAQLLRDYGVEPPMKTSPRTGNQTYAFAKTDLGFQALLSHRDEAIQLLARARVAVKSTIGETRAHRLAAAGAGGKRLPVLLNYSGAHTHRWSGGNKINLQNLPRGGELRRSILAPPGHFLLVADLAQIEARLNVWFARQLDILRAFARGEDVYRIMAGKIYSKAPNDVTSDERFIGKICVLGLGYGMGWKKLRATLAIGQFGPPVNVSESEARRIVQIYRASNPAVVNIWEVLNGRLGGMAYNPDLRAELRCVNFLFKMVELPNGLALKYPGLRADEGEWGPEYTYLGRYGRSKIYGGLMLENIIQALARCVIGEQVVSVNRHWRVATTTHDELVVVVPEDEIKDAEKEVELIMTTPPVWAPDLPLAVEMGYDVNYSK